MDVKKVFIGIINILIFSSACTEKSTKAPEKFNRQDFMQHSALKGKQIQFDVLADNPGEYYIAQDSLLFVEKRKANPYYIEIYNLHKQTLIQEIARRGKGPNEFLSASYRNKRAYNDTFFIDDVVKSEFSFYSIDSILAGNPNPLKRVKVPRYTHDCDIFNKDTLVCFNHYYFKSKQFNNDVKPLFFIKLANADNEAKKGLIGNYYTPNVNSSYVFSSPVNDKIFLFHRHTDKLRIFNKKLELERILQGPDKLEPQYTVRNSASSNHVSFKEGFYSSYYDIRITKSAIYALYSLEIKGQISNKTSEVFKFDWDGNLIHRYELDKIIFNISLDSDGKYLYSTGYENVKTYSKPHLIRYTLK